MKRLSYFSLLLLSFLNAEFAFCAEDSVNFKENKIAVEASNYLKEFAHSSFVTFLLYSCITLVLLGIFFRLYKLVAAAGLAAILISAFRVFSQHLFGTYSILQLKIIIPIFSLTILSKFAYDYISKKRELSEIEREKTDKVEHKRRKITPASATSLSRFGDSFEKKKNKNLIKA